MIANRAIEWDSIKAEENLKKHGVDFDEALTVFVDPSARIFDDPDAAHHDRRADTGKRGPRAAARVL